MYDFLVLGLIPGTDVRISFSAWVLISVPILGWLARKKLRYIKTLIRQGWAKRFHLAAIASLATLSWRRKSHD